MSALFDQVQAHAGRLDVYVAERKVGVLERSGARGSVFAYLPDAMPDDFVSLLMPVRLQSYGAASALIPVFQQNLPEGFLRRAITERFGKLLATDDFMLLALTGADAIGRVKVVPSTFARDWSQAARADVEAVLASDRASTLFAELLAQFVGLGVSGVLPKMLVRERATVRDDQWILKTGDERLPSLAVNEFFTMRAAALAGFETPECKLSQDGAVLGVRRFDRGAAGEPLGFEDFCALLAYPPERKYSGTMERVFKAIEAFTLGPARSQAKETMLAAQLFSMAAGNTDAHLKNFGLLYADRTDVRLAPLFDLVTTRVYPAYRNDVPAISIAGKKLDALDKTFMRFANQAGITNERLRAMAERIAHGLKEAAEDLRTYGRAHRRHRPMADRMVQAWDKGIGRLAMPVPSSARNRT